MKLTAQVKLLPSQEQYDALQKTLETANRACNYISEQAWETGTFGQFKLQKLTYATVKGNFGLSAQVDRKSTRLNSSHEFVSRMPSSA